MLSEVKYTLGANTQHFDSFCKSELMFSCMCVDVLYLTLQLSDTYTLLLTGVKGSLGAKKLSAGFIVRFFPLFPELSDKAIEALIDLCEDEDIVV